MHRGQDDGHPLLHTTGYMLMALMAYLLNPGVQVQGEREEPVVKKENHKDICYITGESKDVVSTFNKLEDNKEENNENDEDMFDRVSGCLQEREAATFGAGSAPETAAPETADWPAPGPCQPTPCFCNSGSAHEGDAVADAATCTCCWL